jgi:uncharacterized UPF0160 family protein
MAIQVTTPLHAHTHPGIFHADEILGLVIAKLSYRGREVIITRSRNPKDWETADLVLDVGGVYDPAHGRFDHHQGDFDRTYPGSAIKMSTAGLVWEHYELRAIAKATDNDPDRFEAEQIAEEVLKNLIVLVDAHDNGQDEPTVGVRHSDEVAINCSFSHIISGFNERENGFEQALELAERVLENTISFAWRRIRGKKLVNDAFSQATYLSNGRGQGIMVLDEFTPWQQHLSELDPNEAIGFCVYPDVSGQWRCQTVKDKNGDDIKSLPESWGALRADALQEVTGVLDAVFCHKNLFIAGAETKEGAIRLAKLAVLN